MSSIQVPAASIQSASVVSSLATAGTVNQPKSADAFEGSGKRNWAFARAPKASVLQAPKVTPDKRSKECGIDCLALLCCCCAAECCCLACCN